MFQTGPYHEKRTLSQGFLLLLAVLALAAFAPLPAFSQQDRQDGQRQDESMTTGGGVHTGENARGDAVMDITPPKRKQEMPEIGPIYVYPQVNQPGRPVNPVVPMPPAQRQAPGARP